MDSYNQVFIKNLEDSKICGMKFKRLTVLSKSYLKQHNLRGVRTDLRHEIRYFCIQCLCNEAKRESFCIDEKISRMQKNLGKQSNVKKVVPDKEDSKLYIKKIKNIL